MNFFNFVSNAIYFQPYFLNEILVPAMVAAGELNRLQQFLHYRVIPDAKQLVGSFSSLHFMELELHCSLQRNLLFAFV